MRSITKLAPVDPATSSARRIIDKVCEHVIHTKLKEIEARVEVKALTLKEAGNGGR